MSKLRILSALFSLTLLGTSPVWAARDQISVVGSSTVYPFTTLVAERFGRSTGFKTPKVESTGTGGGMKQFCAGVGEAFPDVTNASRAITDSELADCEARGVEVVELKIGYDGIVLVSSMAGQQMSLSLRDIYLALAAWVPNASGQLVRNPYQTWQQVNPALPNEAIEVLGPPPTSGTRDAFLELVMLPGAESIELLHELEGVSAADLREALTGLGVNAEAYAEMTRGLGNPTGADLVELLSFKIREDGKFIEAGENDNLIVQKLGANPRAVGIMGFSFLDQNQDIVRGHAIEGVAPDFDAIASGDYAVSRPLFIYVKKNHIGVVPGMMEFLNEFVSENAVGEFGYLSDRGLIPLAADEYDALVESLENMAVVHH